MSWFRKKEPVKQQPIQISPEGHTFLEGILADTGMTHLDRELREEMLKELAGRLDAYISGAIVAHMPERYLDTFTSMCEQRRPRAEIERFMHEHIPNVSQVMTAAFANFREQYVRKGG